ncbi:MAG: hypothetical protein DPW09_40545 [Anaerolineae bacterium]|nr:hypothetical protein [Anaerolineae bacterium]
MGDTLLHAQINQIGVDVAGGLDAQVELNLGPGFDQGFDDGLVKVIPLPPIYQRGDGNSLVSMRLWPGWRLGGGLGLRRRRWLRLGGGLRFRLRFCLFQQPLGQAGRSSQSPSTTAKPPVGKDSRK